MPVKDNISLIAAATGGFILAIALTALLRGAPITSNHALKFSSTHGSLQMVTQPTKKLRLTSDQSSSYWH